MARPQYGQWLCALFFTMTDGEITLSFLCDTYNNYPVGGLLGVYAPDNADIEYEAGAQSITDEELIVRVSRGDAMAFEALVNRYQKPALRVARRFIGRLTEAEDIAQEAFLRVHRHARRYNPETAPFKTWFFAILTNLCRNAIRSNRTLSFTELPEGVIAIDGPEGALAREEERGALAAAVAKLPPNQRTALILRHYEGFSYSEGAAALGLSVKAFGSLLSRAKLTLRRELTKSKKTISTDRSFSALRV
jgi:RNA polymerase sigma-70 factor (ECF subfamily)